MKKSFFSIVVLFTFLQVTTAQKTDPSKDWTIGVQLWTFNTSSFVEAIENAKTAGLTYVQAFPGQKLGGSFKGQFDQSLDAATRKQVKDFVKSKGIIINAFGVTGADNAAEWKKIFDFAKFFNIPVIVAEPGVNQWDLVDKLAGEYHIKIAIHDHPKPSHYWHPDSVLAAIKNHPNIGACADLGHWTRNGLNLVDCLKKLQGRIYNVHVKDVDTFNKVDAEDVVPGKGVIDFTAVFKELKRQNFKGSFSIEHESNFGHNVGEVKDIVAFYHQQVAALK